jgi:hypothetical protein
MFDNLADIWHPQVELAETDRRFHAGSLSL